MKKVLCHDCSVNCPDHITYEFLHSLGAGYWLCKKCLDRRTKTT